MKRRTKISYYPAPSPIQHVLLIVIGGIVGIEIGLLILAVTHPDNLLLERVRDLLEGWGLL